MGMKSDEGLLFRCRSGSVCGRDFAGLVYGLSSAVRRW